MHVISILVEKSRNVKSCVQKHCIFSKIEQMVFIDVILNLNPNWTKLMHRAISAVFAVPQSKYDTCIKFLNHLS